MPYRNIHKDRWDILVLFLATLNAFLVPLELVFVDMIEEIGGDWYSAIDGIVDVLFFIDMVIMFMTSFRHRNGNEIWEPKEIAINYVT